MKICHIINSLNRGGAESHLLDLVSAQIRNDYDVKIVVIGKDSKTTSSIENEIDKLGIEIKRLSGPRMYNLFSYFSLGFYLINKELDIIHSHQPRSDFMIYILRKVSKKISSISWVVSVHGKYDTYLEGNKLGDYLRKIFMKRLSKFWLNATTVIAISDEVKEWISKLNSSIEARVIPYWVKRNNIKKVNNDKLTIGFLGRLNKNKGIEDLLHALNKLNYKENNLDVIIGGHGDEKYIKKLKSILNEEVNKYVDFLGFVDDRDDYFNKVDIFVFPSYSEGLGLVLLEAMSYSKVCITRNIMPMKKYIDNENGYLFDDLESLITNLNSAINDLSINYSVIEKKLSNIDKTLEKSREEKIFPMFQEAYKNE